MSAPSKLVVGLGNPGGEYAKTRHNVGWMVVDRLSETLRAKAIGGVAGKFGAELYRDNDRLLAKPTTMMNQSGSAVRAIAEYYKIDPRALLIVSDDIDLPFGELRFRDSGSSGGHKGLADIISQVGSADVPRLRIGVGRPADAAEAADHVLSRFTKREQQALPDIIESAVERVREWLDE